MRLWTREFPMQKRQPDRNIALLLSVIPGLGQLILNRRSRGAHLLVFGLGMSLVLVGRWNAFRVAFSTRDIGAWIASLFVIVSLIATVVFSVWDIWRLLKEHSLPQK